MDDLKELLVALGLAAAIVMGLLLLFVGLDELIKLLFGYGKV